LNSSNSPAPTSEEPAVEATLAAPLIEDSNAHETSTSSISIVEAETSSEAAAHPAADSAIDAVKTSAPQESHA